MELPLPESLSMWLPSWSIYLAGVHDEALCAGIDQHDSDEVSDQVEHEERAGCRVEVEPEGVPGAVAVVEGRQNDAQLEDVYRRNDEQHEAQSH